MEINSNRIIIREFLETDWSVLHELYAKPETIKYNPSGYPENEQATKNLVADWAAQNSLKERRNYTFLISNRNDKSFIGVISLDFGRVKYKNAEVWYKLEPQFWGKGYATEALQAILDFGFNTLDLHRIECGCSVKNIASFKVMEKSGMIREGIKRSLLPLEDGWHDAVIYSILQKEFVKETTLNK